MDKDSLLHIFADLLLSNIMITHKFEFRMSCTIEWVVLLTLSFCFFHSKLEFSD